MGYALEVELDLQTSDAPSLTRWGSKGMLDALAMSYEVFGFGSILDLAAQRLGVDVTPLHKVTNPELQLEDFLEGIDPDDRGERTKWEQRFQEFDQRRNNAWQSPTALLTSIEDLIGSLDNHPAVFQEVGVAADPYGKYFLSGRFRKELDDLLKIVHWAHQNGVPRLRLIWL